MTGRTPGDAADREKEMDRRVYNHVSIRADIIYDGEEECGSAEGHTNNFMMQGECNCFQWVNHGACY
jgi:hypothetical protein